MKRWGTVSVLVMVLVLIILHQDYWQWTTTQLDFGGMLPRTLTYHAVISILAAGLWLLAATLFWPSDRQGDAR